MFPNEIAILMAIDEAEELTKEQLTHVTDVAGTALRYLCDSLIRRGYLELNNSRGYRLTFKGKEAILEALSEMKLGLYGQGKGLSPGERDDIYGNVEVQELSSMLGRYLY